MNRNDLPPGGPRRGPRRRDWRRVHHSPIFWVGVVLFLAASGVYVLTEDLSWRPRIH